MSKSVAKSEDTGILFDAEFPIFSSSMFKGGMNMIGSSLSIVSGAMSSPVTIMLFTRLDVQPSQ